MVRRRRKIDFKATKTIPKKVRVSFETKKGQRVSFKATKQIPKRVKVEFYAKRKKK
jgi:bifunctional DNA-binding transcriptional regulator/antitoxin component of YhaV-PrlF toxin-antitoxin module